MKKKVLGLLSLALVVGALSIIGTINTVSCMDNAEKYATPKQDLVKGCKDVMNSVADELKDVQKKTEDDLVKIINAKFLTEDEIITLLEDGYFLTRIQEFIDSEALSQTRANEFLKRHEELNLNKKNQNSLLSTEKKASASNANNVKSEVLEQNGTITLEVIYDFGDAQPIQPDFEALEEYYRTHDPIIISSWN